MYESIMMHVFGLIKVQTSQFNGPSVAQGNTARPTLMNLSTTGGLSANSLSGPPIASQPPTVDAGFRPGLGQYQPRPNHPSQGIPLFQKSHFKPTNN